MNLINKKSAIFTIIMIFSILAIAFFNKYLPFINTDTTNLKIFIYIENSYINRFAADSSIEIPITAKVVDNLGTLLSNINVDFNLNNDLGSLTVNKTKTGKNGIAKTYFIPKELTISELQKNSTVEISANMSDTDRFTKLSISLAPIPTVLLHGYRGDKLEFENLNKFLSTKGFDSHALQYTSTIGAISASKELSAYLENLKMNYLKSGIYVKKFNLICHSYGGLVARYYTCIPEYLYKDDVKRLIFISSPHNGTYAADLAQGIYNDISIKELQTNSYLINTIFPTMMNKGLNNTIMTANLLAQYDEVVSPESASIENWSIKTELFNIGENNVNVENLISGKITEAKNHHLVLQNKKVFQRIFELLNSQLSYPSIQK